MNFRTTTISESNRSLLFFLIIFSLIIFSEACKSDGKIDCDDFHWSYEGQEAPNTWQNCYADCGGQAQSPINITGAVADAALADLETHYEDVPIELINNGHTVEFEYEAGSIFKVNGEDFELLQFHFHTGSEHNVNGNQYPMEVHLVHKNAASGELAVIGIFLEEGDENIFLKNFSDNLPINEDDHYSSAINVNVTDLLPVGTAYYTYSGSLTTPPCSEIVTWFVMKDPVQASATQINAFHAIMHDNFRPIQTLNGRSLREH